MLYALVVDMVIVHLQHVLSPRSCPPHRRRAIRLLPAHTPPTPLPVRCTRHTYESHLTQSCVYNGHIHSGSHRSTPGIRSTRRGEYRTALDSRTWSRAGSSIVSVSVWSHPCLYDAAAYVWGICQGGMWAGYVRMRRRRQQPCGSAAVWRAAEGEST